LRQYWEIQRPRDYLFPGSHAGTHVQPGTIQEICQDACRMAGTENADENFISDALSPTKFPIEPTR
jgi:hypothetical protein